MMTKGEETTLIKIDKQLAVLNNNFGNHIKNDEEHKKYIKKKLDSIDDRMKSGDDKFDNLNVAVFGTDVEKHKDGLVEKLNSHTGEYHKDNEEKWGSQTYFKNHLKQFAIMIVVAIFGLSLLGYNINSIAQVALKAVGVKIELPKE